MKIEINSQKIAWVILGLIWLVVNVVCAKYYRKFGFENNFVQTIVGMDLVILILFLMSLIYRIIDIKFTINLTNDADWFSKFVEYFVLFIITTGVLITLVFIISRVVDYLLVI